MATIYKITAIRNTYNAPNYISRLRTNLIFTIFSRGNTINLFKGRTKITGTGKTGTVCYFLDTYIFSGSK